MKTIAVVLSGCGFKDGAEITESVSTLISLSELGANYQVFAPNIDFTPTNHISGQSGEKRNVLTEASRISRGDIKDLKELSSKSFDAVVFPGGFGAALHLCTWAKDGANCTVHPEAKRVLEEFYNDGKPIGAICISPALVAKVLGSKNVTLTIGDDKETAQEIEKTGAHHENCAVDDYVTDRENKIISTPAYMYDDAKPNKVFTGINRAIKELTEMA